MSSSTLGRLLMTAAILLYGAIPPLADFNATHAMHPAWSPHSRLHLVWLVVSNSAVATRSLYGGALSDPGGVPPVGPFDANALGFSLISLLLLGGWILAERGPTGG